MGVVTYKQGYTTTAHPVPCIDDFCPICGLFYSPFLELLLSVRQLLCKSFVVNVLIVRSWEECHHFLRLSHIAIICYNMLTISRVSPIFVLRFITYCMVYVLVLNRDLFTGPSLHE